MEQNTEKIVMDNGLKIIFKQKETNSFYLYLSLKVGSSLEKKGEKGYSHLLEHLIFEGTEKRPDAKLISQEIENVGGELNAATSTENTVYYAKVLSENYDVAIDVISDMVINSKLSSEKVEKEKKVVLEEIKMVNDQPRYYQWVLLEKQLFSGTPYSSPVYGEVADVENATSEKLKKFYSTHYTPDNATLVILGDFKQGKEKIVRMIQSCFNKWKGENKIQQVVNIPTKPVKFTQEEREIQQVYYLNSILTPSVLHPDSAVIEVIEAILGKPQSGRINDEIRNKKGLAYDVHVSYENMKNFGFFVISVSCDKKNLTEVKNIIKKSYLLENLNEIELNTAKSYIKGRIVLELEDLSRQADSITFWEELKKEDYTLEYLKKINNVTLQDIKRVLKYFKNAIEVQLIPKKHINANNTI